MMKKKYQKIKQKLEEEKLEPKKGDRFTVGFCPTICTIKSIQGDYISYELDGKNLLVREDRCEFL
jgi:hypothetical protein